MSTNSKTIYILPNAHLDPVWLWDWKEGCSEALRTCRAMVRLLDDYPELKFNRGEALIYEYIAEFDPQLFARIRDLIREGRWGVIGGNAVQPDTNMPSTTAMLHQFRYGTHYFRQHLGVRVRTAWAADSFGHSAGLPDILTQAGMTRFACTRPQPNLLKLPGETFWWEGVSGARILATRLDIGWYGANDDEMTTRLDRLLDAYADRPVRTIATGCGCGDHGGGTTRHQLDDIQAWRDAHPDVDVRFATFDEYFDALEAEIATGAWDVPVHRGEMNFCLRGCYASMAGVKRQYRRMESAVRLADRVCLLAEEFPKACTAEADAEWRAVLYNGFHDILPGSAIERALEQQTDQMRGAVRSAETRAYRSLVQLSQRVRVTVPTPGQYLPELAPLFVFNPTPHPYRGLAEVETCFDYRPCTLPPDADWLEVLDAQDQPVPFQRVANDGNFCGNGWRARVLAPVDIPPFGWTQLKVGVEPEPKRIAHNPDADRAEACGPAAIRNGHLTITAQPGTRAIVISRPGQPDIPLSFALYDDRGGSWGGGESEPAVQLQQLVAVWTIAQAKVTEDGPLRAALFVRLDGRQSSLDLTIRLERGANAFSADTRLLWNERGTRLKLRLPAGDTALYDVPGGECRRRQTGQVPGIRYVRVLGDDGHTSCAFAANGGYGYDMMNGHFTWTLQRSSLYATNGNDINPLDHPERPCERGEIKQSFAWAASPDQAPALADALDFPLQWFLSWPHDGELPPTGSLSPLSLPPHIDLADAFVDDGILNLVLQNRSDTPATITLRGHDVTLPPWVLVTVPMA